MLETVTAEKVDKKMGSFVQIPSSLPKLWSLNFLKKFFLQFCAHFGKKFKPNTSIYIDAFERSRYTVSENVVYYAMTYCFGDIRVCSI